MKTGLTAGTRKNCHNCDKEFTIWLESDWAYKKHMGHGKNERTLYFCTWSCLRAWEKENDRKKGKHKIEEYTPYD